MYVFTDGETSLCITKSTRIRVISQYLAPVVLLGSIYYRLGWNRMAMDNWQYALELDPKNEGLKKYLMRLSR